MLFLALCGACGVLAPPVQAQSLQQLREMSIEDLAAVSVTSVSKSAQPLGDAAASVYVISREDILRSGAVTLPEILQLAPNLQVYEAHPGSWVVTARGMNGNAGAQSYSNKLLVLIDGRTVYTPLFSGVYWDLPDPMPNDIDRIEVISGPGATLWGANAVNGVINVITRKASESTGVYASFREGSDERTAGVRLGGNVNDRLSYRIYARWLQADSILAATGLPAGNGQNRTGGGFRLDWQPGPADAVSMEGEAFGGHLYQSTDASEATAGRSLQLRWNHGASDSNAVQVQAFYDRISRASWPKSGSFFVDTYDAEVQHNIALDDRNRFMWGGGLRLADYHIDGSTSFFFDPSARNLFFANGFAQDSFQITPRLTLTGGLKLESDPYSGTSLLPEGRIAWKPRASTLLWGAISRAVRSPTPFDVDAQERAGIVSLSGNPNFRTEKLTAFELGTRVQPASTVSFSVNGYYNTYDDLRTVEIVPGPGLTLMWGNGLQGNSHGVDAWADWRTARWWTLSAGVSWLEEHFHFAPGASGILGTTQIGNDPSYQVKLRSAMNLGAHFRLDADFRAVGALVGSAVGGYRELGGRFAWIPSPAVVVSISGHNLLHARHQEYPGGDLIPRQVLACLELRY